MRLLNFKKNEASRLFRPFGACQFPLFFPIATEDWPVLPLPVDVSLSSVKLKTAPATPSQQLSEVATQWSEIIVPLHFSPWADLSPG